jgi:cyanophycin synthetase
LKSKPYNLQSGHLLSFLAHKHIIKPSTIVYYWYKNFVISFCNKSRYMEILELRVLKGPNYWSTAKKKLIQLLLDPEELRFRFINEIPGFYEHFKKMSFSFDGNEGCDDVTRNLGLQLKEGISLCHVVGFIALELQRISGMNVDFGITSPAGKDGNYYIIFSYEEEAPGVYAAQAAVRITEALICGAGYDIRKEVEHIKKLWVTEKLGPSTASIVEEAQRRNIPFIRLDKGVHWFN